MSHYTNHTFTLAELATIEQQKEDYIDSLNIKLSDPDLQVKDLALMLKSLEIMDNMEHMSSFKEFIVNIASRSAQFVSPNELIINGGLTTKYLTDNLVQNAGFESDAMEVELCKQSTFDSGIDLSSPWNNGIAYKFDTLVAEGTTIISSYSDGGNDAVAWYDVDLKPNTQYKFSYNLIVNNVNWDLPYGGRNMVDIPSVDTQIFSETGGGPDSVQYVVSVIEDVNLDRPTCNGEIAQWVDGGIDQMEIDCLAISGTWVLGNVNDPNTHQHLIVPYHLEAREGDIIHFTNPSNNVLVHNAVSDDNTSFTSPDLNPGESWAWTVDGYHDLYFHCTFHPLEEGRLSTTTNHRYLYNVDHGLNPGDTIKIPVNYGTMEAIPNLSNSYDINIPMANASTSVGGAGDQSVIDSLYHDLSLNQLVTFQSGEVEVDPDAAAPVSVIFAEDYEIDPATAEVTVIAGSVDSITLLSGGLYNSVPDLTISGGGGYGATADVTFEGTLQSITLDIDESLGTSGGEGYVTVPAVEISGGNPTTPAEAVATIVGGVVTEIVITNVGAGYQSAPVVLIIGSGNQDAGGLPLDPTLSAQATAVVQGTITALTLTAGGLAYGSTGGVAEGERQWETYVVAGVTKGSERVDVFLDDVNAMGHIHTLTISTSQYDTIKTGSPTLIETDVDDTGHTHTVTFDWNPALNDGLGGLVLVGMTGTHTHGLDEYYEISGGTKIELVNFGHYHELLITEEDEALLKAAVLIVTGENPDTTASHDGTGTTIIRTSDFGTSDPQHFHTVEFGCVDADNDIYAITAIDQHIHDFGRVWYPGSNLFNISQYDASIYGGDDLNPVSIVNPFTDIPGFVRKARGITSADHGLIPGQRVHFENVFNGIHHGNTNYWVANVVDKDNFVLTETVVYPLQNAPGTTPTTFNVTEQYTVVSDLASYRFQVERDLTNHIGSPFIEGVQLEWSRPNTVNSNQHGLAVGDVVQLPSGPQEYTPSEAPGEMRDHIVVALGDGYGPTENLEIIVDTQTTITLADPNATVVEGAQDTPWYWSWWDRTDISYAPYQRDEAINESFGGNDGTNGGFTLYRGGSYKFINNAWSTMAHTMPEDPIQMYLHAAGIKEITGAGWDNLVTSGFVDNDGDNCVSMRANHGLTIVSGDHNDFVNTEEEPGTWVGNEPFPDCAQLGGWCEELDVDGWYYNGVDTEDACVALNPTDEVGLAQWRMSQFIGNFSQEFTWNIPEDFGLTGSDGTSGFGPFVPPGELNGSYNIEAYNGLYKFDKSGMIEGTNRTLNLYRGGTYRFHVNAVGHPFYFTTDDGTHFTPGTYFGEYTLGVTGTRTEVGPGVQSEGDIENLWGNDDSGVPKYGVVEITIAESSPDTIFYQCGWHGSMSGVINVIDLPSTGVGENVVVYYHHGQDNMYTPLHIQDKIIVDNGTGPNFFQVQPVPEYAFPVQGTQAQITGVGNLITAAGLGITPTVEVRNIELGTEQWVDAVVMTKGVGVETFMVSNDFTGTAKFYISTKAGERTNFTLSDVSFTESPWIEIGSFQVEAGTAFTTDAQEGGTLEQIVTGSVTAGEEYEIGYEVLESFVDGGGFETGTIQVKLVGDTTVEGAINTVVGLYTETLTAPVNTTKMVIIATGVGKLDNISLRERVTGQNAWFFGEGWDTVLGQAYADGTVQSLSEISQTVPFQPGLLYEVTYNLANLDPEGDGSQGRLQLALGSNPYNLIKNWNFDAQNQSAINWTTSGTSITLSDSRLNFVDAVNQEIIYTFSDNLSNNAEYELQMDVESVSGTIHNFRVYGGANHEHSFELTQSEYDFLRYNEGAALTTIQTDGIHADLYQHTFTVTFDSSLVSVIFTISGGESDHPHTYTCSYDDYNDLKSGNIDELDMTHLTQTDISHAHGITIEYNLAMLDYVLTSDDNEDHVHDAIVLTEADAGIRIPTYTFWENHDDVEETTLIAVISDIIFSLGQDANEIETDIINTVGNHIIPIEGTIGNTASVKVNGTGIINSVRLHEVQIPILDHTTTGIVEEGIKTIHIRAGDYDDKIHFIGDIDSRPEEQDSPFYYSRGFKGSIDDVTVKLLEENWAFMSNVGGEAYVDHTSETIHTSGTGPNNRGIAYISFAVVEGQNYKVYLNVDRPADSAIKIGPAPDDSQYALFTIFEGEYEGHRDFVFTSTSTGICYLTLTSIGNGFTNWDNVSVKTIPNLSSDEYLLLARGLNVFGMPIGGEERWRQHHIDTENQDYTGQVLSGFRTLESFGENIVEMYYDVALRQEVLLDNLKIVWMSQTEGYMDTTVTIEGTGFKSDMILTIGGIEQVVQDIHIPTLITFTVNGLTPLVASDVVLTTLTNDQYTIVDGFKRIQ